MNRKLLLGMFGKGRFGVSRGPGTDIFIPLLDYLLTLSELLFEHEELRHPCGGKKK